MKKRLKSFLKYTLFSGVFSAAIASPIASPGTSTIYNGVNSGILYSPTVNNNGISCSTIHYLVNEHVQGWYSETVDLSPFTQCSNATLVIKAAGGKGGIHGGLGGITILRIPLQTIINYYGSKVTFYYAVGGAAHVQYGGGNGGNGWNTDDFYSYNGGGGGGETLVSLINWPWYGGIPLAIGGGGGGGYTGWNGCIYNYGCDSYSLFQGGGGGGGNDPGQQGQGVWSAPGGGYGSGGIFGGISYWCILFGGSPTYWGNGTSGWWGNGGSNAGPGGGGGGGYGGGSASFSVGSGGGGGGYCNTSLGSCQALDWTNGGGNPGNGYVEIYVKSNG